LEIACSGRNRSTISAIFKGICRHYADADKGFAVAFKTKDDQLSLTFPDPSFMTFTDKEIMGGLAT